MHLLFTYGINRFSHEIAHMLFTAKPRCKCVKPNILHVYMYILHVYVEIEKKLFHNRYTFFFAKDKINALNDLGCRGTGGQEKEGGRGGKRGRERGENVEEKMGRKNGRDRWRKGEGENGEKGRGRREKM